MFKITTIIVSALLTASFILPSQAESVLDKIKRTGLLEVGIRDDAAPFGYRDRYNNLEGVCLDLINLIKEEIKKELSLDIISIKIYQSTLNNRFELVSNKRIDLECAYNTITHKPDANIDFSRPFFITGTQFLVKKLERGKINIYRNLINVNIGVLRDTTTQQFIENRFPLAKVQTFQGQTARSRGIQALQRGRIDAFASDGILLIGEAVLLDLSIGDQYILVPQTPLECSYYGLILPKDDPVWRDFINGVIGTKENRRIFRNWFSIITPYLKQVIQACPVNSQS
ncbi:MAG: Glutamate/aspartate import solute-binding protein [Chroococcopsis gigantea SAG 12.99]|nr:Glutamate/aspartate import solute-binding protein [Chroococcopsis gigantea SAG 12.99]